MSIMVSISADQIIDINSELDELDREEFYRLKKVVHDFSVLDESVP